MNQTDEVSELDRLYMLDVDTPSEKWTQAAKSPYSPAVNEHIELAREALQSAQMLGAVLIGGWSLTLAVIGWILWRVFHG